MRIIASRRFSCVFWSDVSFQREHAAEVEGPVAGRILEALFNLIVTETIFAAQSAGDVVADRGSRARQIARRARLMLTNQSRSLCEREVVNIII